MSRFSRARVALARKVAGVSNYITNSQELMRYLSGVDQVESDTGLPVTVETAMRMSAVFSCVRVLSEDIASLPLYLYDRPGPQKNQRSVITGHWLTDLMDKPNPWQTGFEFREMEQAHLELNGNFFGLKTVVGQEVREILPTHPGRWTVEQLPNWKVQYKFTGIDGVQNVVPNELVYHVRGLSLDGIMGLSPISYQRETIGFGMALAKYGSKLFKNGASPSGVLSAPGEMSDQAYARLKESFEEKYAGLDGAGKVILLEEGATFTATGMKADDAQFLESRKFSRSEICGFYRVPPHFIGDLDRATFSNIEQQSKDYVQKALLPRLRRRESRMLLALIPEAKRKFWYFLHDVDGLLRGDFSARMSGYQTAILTGWLTRNQAREMESLNPGPKELDEYLVPSNEMLAKTMGKETKKEEPPKPDREDDTQPKERLRAI